MARYSIVFAPLAEKQFMRLPRLARARIASAIAKLATDPFLGKQLKAQLKDYRSYRVGNYRVVYYIRQHKIQIEIIRVAHRKEAYRN